MRTRIAGAIAVCLVFASAVACGGATPAATPTQTLEAVPKATATPTEAPPRAGPTPSKLKTPATSRVTGTITYRERMALSPDAVVEVKLSDVSRADAPAITIGEQVIENPGQVPIDFEIGYDPDAIDERLTYSVQARIIEGGNLAFINDTAYNVITRNNPDHVDMVLVRVGESPGEPAPTEPAMAETPAPIESVEVVVSESEPQKYSLKIVSGLPSGCVEFKGYDVSLDANVFTVDVVNLEPVGPVGCIAIYETHEGEVALDGNLAPGETYTVIVNGEVTNTFQVRNDRTSGWVEESSPIENVEVVVSESDPPTYSLNVLSTLPQGGTCSAFNGYDISRRSHDTIEVEVTHLKVAPGQIIPCTADLPAVSSEISLGTDFVPGERYSVIVNGQTETFTAGTMAFELGPCRMTRAAQLPIEFEYKGTVPTGFDGINRASCTFTKPVETVTVTLTGPATHTERFTLAEPSAEVSFPLPDGTLSITTKEIVLPGEYEREMTVASVDGEMFVISDQPSVLRTIKVLERGG